MEDLCRTEPVGMKPLHNGRITACCGVHPADGVSNEASGPERGHVDMSPALLPPVGGNV